MRKVYIQQLDQLNQMLTEMGGLIGSAIVEAIRALKDQDIELAEKAIAGDEIIDQKERDIESLCLKLLLHQQPVAGDLRLISAAMRMVGDMERIGDHAADISEITIHMAGTSYIKELVHIPQMAQIAIGMVSIAVDAFVNKDLNLANSVIEQDDRVDELFKIIRSELIELNRADGANSEQVLDLMMIAKYIERIGDHAENIAEWVVFSITGEHKRVSWDDGE